MVELVSPHLLVTIFQCNHIFFQYNREYNFFSQIAVCARCARYSLEHAFCAKRDAFLHNRINNKAHQIEKKLLYLRDILKHIDTPRDLRRIEDHRRVGLLFPIEKEFAPSITIDSIENRFTVTSGEIPWVKGNVYRGG